jgi:hypothetical protein
MRKTRKQQFIIDSPKYTVGKNNLGDFRRRLSVWGNVESRSGNPEHAHELIAVVDNIIREMLEEERRAEP